jgi:hypothetical protein
VLQLVLVRLPFGGSSYNQDPGQFAVQQREDYAPTEGTCSSLPHVRGKVRRANVLDLPAGDGSPDYVRRPRPRKRKAKVVETRRLAPGEVTDQFIPFVAADADERRPQQVRQAFAEGPEHRSGGLAPKKLGLGAVEEVGDAPHVSAVLRLTVVQVLEARF